MTFDEVARLAVQPVGGPPGPRVLAILTVSVVAGVAWMFRAAAHSLTLVTRSRPQAVPVEIRHRALRSDWS